MISLPISAILESHEALGDLLAQDQTVAPTVPFDMMIGSFSEASHLSRITAQPSRPTQPSSRDRPGRASHSTRLWAKGMIESKRSTMTLEVKKVHDPGDEA